MGPHSLCSDFQRLSTQFASFSDRFTHGSLNLPSQSPFTPVLNSAALGAASPPLLFPAGSSCVSWTFAHLLLPCLPPTWGLRRAALLGQHSSSYCELTPLLKDWARCCRGFCVRVSPCGVHHWTLSTFQPV